MPISLIHSVWLTDDDIALLGTRGASVVHNPASNLTLGSGIAPVNKLARSGVNIALGTDGSNCGGNLTMFRSLSLAAMLSKVTTPVHEEWRWAGEVLAIQVILFPAELPGFLFFLQRQKEFSTKCRIELLRILDSGS
ncbi:MAG: 5-methylthioadenosine/S-adenosylhomocysteine deaminase [Clostridia bacterium]|nr:5-methylthioadenosine/S-adenosylhomocysteine deaminase [Clostridia bacterium]